ncbi:MAG: membrane protein insertion efficiency factor YidD [Actinomycetota bacterium]
MTSFRRVLWNAGAPARLVLLAAIRTYQLTLSAWLGGQCRFSPTCSRYAEEAIRSWGATRGSFLAARRVLRCNPFGRGGLDPVPQPRLVYDTSIRRATDPTVPHLNRRHHAG